MFFLEITLFSSLVLEHWIAVAGIIIIEPVWYNNNNIELLTWVCIPAWKLDRWEVGVCTGTPGRAWRRRGGAGARSSVAGATRGGGTKRAGALGIRTGRREPPAATPAPPPSLTPRLYLQVEAYFEFHAVHNKVIICNVNFNF